MNNFFFIILTILLNLIESYKCINIDLVFSLQEYFSSDVILVASNGGSNFDSVKEFHKFKKSRLQGFIGFFDISNERFSENLKSPYQNVMVVSDNKTNLIEKLLSNFHTSPNLMSSAIWVNFFQENITKKLQHLYIPFNCKFLIIKENDEIEDVYQISEYYPKIYSKFGLWENGHLEVFERNFFNKRMNLNGYRFNVAETYLKQYAENYHKVWKLFSEAMNFSINWDSRDYGELFSNGTKTGIFKLITERDIDGTGNNYLYTQNRLNHFDYIFPTLLLESRFYLKRNTDLVWDSYIEPFNTKVWLTILIWIIISSLIIHLIVRLNRCIKSESSFFIIIKALFSQGGTLNSSSSLSLCVAHLMPQLLALILMGYYSGVLLSHVTVQEFHLPFKNLEGLIEDGSYKISALDGTYNLFYFKTDRGPIGTAVRQKNLLVEPDKLPKDTNTAFDQICENRWIYLGRPSNFLIQAKCEIIDLNYIVSKNCHGIIVWKGFPFKNVMTKLLKKLHSTGLVKLIQKDVIHSTEKQEIFKPFSIELVFPIFIVYLVFIVISLLVLLIEFMTIK